MKRKSPPFMNRRKRKFKGGFDFGSGGADVRIGAGKDIREGGRRGRGG